MSEQIKVGIIGCGNISGAYFRGCKVYDELEVTACADALPDRAEARAREFGVRALSVEQLLADPEIRIVLNLTVPKAHGPINLAILKAGKIPYCEKPFAVSRAEGRKVLELARKKRLRTGCAPDTFLGAGVQTSRHLIDQGAIGRPVAGAAFVAFHGHESWHPDPGFFYAQGGGPMLDMGVYYVTALVNLLGPVKRVCGITQNTFPERLITSQPLAGKTIRSETDTHIAGVMEFHNGAVVTILASFDVWHHHLPIIEIYGSEGSLAVPDPNHFRGPVRIRKAGEKEWRDVPLTHNDQISRGIGVADLARGLLHGRTHRCSGELGFHVLDVMLAFPDSSRSGKHIKISSRCGRPAPLPAGLPLGTLD